MASMSCTLQSNTTVSRRLYDDFSTPTPCRSAKLIVQDRVLYVNAGWLAELSPYFATLFFGECPSDEVRVSSDLLYEHVLELLRVVFYCPTRKPITEANLALVMRLATKFDIRPVIERCEEIITRRVDLLDRNRLFQLACVVAHCDRHSRAMALIIDKLSNMSGHELSTLQFSQVPGDVVADVFAAKMKRRAIKERRWCCFF